MELTLHHVKEDGDRGFPQLRFWDQCHLQDRPHHFWDELDFMLTFRRKDAFHSEQTAAGFGRRYKINIRI